MQDSASIVQLQKVLIFFMLKNVCMYAFHRYTDTIDFEILSLNLHQNTIYSCFYMYKTAADA